MLFKVLSPDLQAMHGGTYQYREGRWTPKRDPVVCVSGWHVVDAFALSDWLTTDDCVVYAVDVRGRCDSNYAAARAYESIRLSRRVEVDRGRLAAAERTAWEAYEAARRTLRAAREAACESIEREMGWGGAS